MKYIIKNSLNYAEKYDIINYELKIYSGGWKIMKHIRTINKANLKETAKKGGCGKCQASCQSACKTSCTVGNQSCEKMK